MTLQVTGGDARQTLSIRYFPLLAWSFVALAAYGISTIFIAINDGRQPVNEGVIAAVALLVIFTMFVAATAGQFVTTTFDRSRDLVRIARYSIRGRLIIERPLSEVVGLQVTVLRRAQHRLELQFRSGERLPLTPFYVVTFSNSAMHKISALLGVEPKIEHKVRRF
jgi:hypothetical protein